MHLASLKLKSFRNYDSFEGELSPDVHLVVGDNAQGKTNLLEAIHYLSALRSFRGTSARELVQFGADGARIEGRVVSALGTDDLAVTISAEGRKATVNAKEPASVADYLRVLPSVKFTPDDILLIKGESGPRRKALDRAVFGLAPAHLKHLLDYGRALKQKNALLKSGGGSPDELAVWNARLAEIGSHVIAARLSFIDRVSPLLAEFFAEISASKAIARARYRGITDSPESAQRIRDALLDELTRRQHEELARGFTVVGPHRDDLAMEIAGKSVRRYASQGQHRMFALALKVAEIELHRRDLGRYPVLLLDDVKSELDKDRVRFLFDFLNRIPAQIFVSATSLEELQGEVTRPRLTWIVRNGIAERQ